MLPSVIGGPCGCFGFPAAKLLAMAD
jgi:hypothetical protein